MNQPNLGSVQAIRILADKMPEAVGAQTGVAYARGVANDASRSAGKVPDATARILRDTTRNESARKVATARAAINATKDARSSLSKAKAQLTSDAEVIRTRLSALERTSPEDAAIVAEIRSHFHNQKTLSNKLDLLKQAEASGDSLTVRAILAGPAYLSGMGDDMTQRIRADFQLAQAPEDVAHLANLAASSEVINEIDRAMDDLVNEFNTPEVQGLVAVAKAAAE